MNFVPSEAHAARKKKEKNANAKLKRRPKPTLNIKAFAPGMLNGICRKLLPFLHKNQVSSRLLKINYYKKKIAIVLQCNSTFRITLYFNFKIK